MALSGATIPGQSGPGSNGNEGFLRIPQSSCITGTSQSDSWVSYPWHLLWGSYPYVEKQSAYSTAPANWVKECMFESKNIYKQAKRVFHYKSELKRLSMD